MNLNKYIRLSKILAQKKTNNPLRTNPTDNTLRVDAAKSNIAIYQYDEASINEYKVNSIDKCALYKNPNKFTWINVDGLKREEISQLCAQYNIHSLIEEDITSVGQRPKTDLFENFAYCLLYMLSYNEASTLLHKEQISLILGHNFILTFQEEPNRDAFDKVRIKLKNNSRVIQQSGCDFLYYTLLDAIVDDYFIALDSFGDKIELAEENIVKAHTSINMTYILHLRKELLQLRRAIYPARDVISSIIKNEAEMFDVKTLRYIKDIYDHILQATEMVENYREGLANLQDLHMNQANLKMNESMKVMAVVTCLLAPATVIGGIFGMNFTEIPFLGSHYGFYFSVIIMLIIPIWMLLVFRRKGWF